MTTNFFDDDDEDEEEGEIGAEKAPRRVLVFSAKRFEPPPNYVKALSSHFLNPVVSVGLGNLAYTLGQGGCKLYYRAFSITRSNKAELSKDTLVTGKQASSPPRISFVFTGQGAQWSQMGADLVRGFPLARKVIRDLDAVLQDLPEPPKWTLLEELTATRSSEALRHPESSQPLVTTLQLALLEVLHDWGIHLHAVVGHSSVEIAAAAAAGMITYAGAIKAAFYRGKAANIVGAASQPVGMLAVGVGPERVQQYLRPEEGKV